MIVGNRFNGQLPRDGKKHPPLRSAQELADEFGVPLAVFCAALSNHNGPKAVIVHRSQTRAGHGTQRSYFKHAEARRWWAGVPK